MNAVITGATKGMGRAIAVKLARQGYDLAFCARNEAEIARLKDELLSINNQATVIGFPADCAKKQQLEQFVNLVQQHFKQVDVLINNAGMYVPATLLDEDDDILNQQLAVNLLAPYYLSKQFGKIMRSWRRGHIINIVSVAALNPVTRAGSYSVTKAALLSLTKALRQELMPHGIKVTAILPGSTLTDSWKGTEIPAERFVQAEDVALAVSGCLTMSVGCNVDEIIIQPVKGEV
ncbi:SDR family oxidoreductase [Pedobacter sp. BS3]|uniref:SDR family oxidoreductase n=1 Tax=Pedobacter sp. BS3 TaxID=2567937 RepID=UPI0011EEE0AA|nr:SDR family oxidoreductase [Pedobacter sp. BS3]TZF83022.1 SDR family oxidoreductase [Pedobacter sp. BS3]